MVRAGQTQGVSKLQGEAFAAARVGACYAQGRKAVAGARVVLQIDELRHHIMLIKTQAHLPHTAGDCPPHRANGVLTDRRAASDLIHWAVVGAAMVVPKKAMHDVTSGADADDVVVAEAGRRRCYYFLELLKARQPILSHHRELPRNGCPLASIGLLRGANFKPPGPWAFCAIHS